MKIFCTSFLINFIFFVNSLNPIKINHNITILSKVLHDVVDEFLVKEKILFNIYLMKGQAVISSELLNEFAIKNCEKFKFFISYYDKKAESIAFKRTVIILLDRLDDFLVFEMHSEISRFLNEPIKFIIIAQNLTFSILSSHWIFATYKSLDVFSGSIFHHSYFITVEEDTISLSAVEWFSQKACNHPHLIKLNSFDKKSMKWTSKLENYEKFFNFHGCELVLLLPAPQRRTILFYVDGYAEVNDDQTNFNIRGLTPQVFKIASKVGNFTEAYQPVYIEYKDAYKVTPNDITIILINGTYKLPQIFLSVGSVNLANKYARMSNAFVDLDVYFVTTPAEAYSPYEKLFLPFDLETWILLILTFLIAFICIFIINCCSKSTQNLFYGDNVNEPFWNVIRIFFGISQTQLPEKNFARFILALFILFCLIFRTCYQNKLFEFTTSEPRRPPPKTIEDLIDRNYNVYTLINNVITSSAEDRVKRR